MMIYGKSPRRWPKVLLAIVIVLIIVACIWLFACDGMALLTDQDEEEQAQEVDTGSAEDAEEAEEEEEEAADELAAEEAEKGTYQEGLDTTISLSAVGDCTLGTDDQYDEETNFTTVYEGNGEEFFFANVLPVTSADDITVANLEGPLTDSEEKAEGRSYNFHGEKSYYKILQEGSVEAVNLANNHSYDYGEEGYEDTKEVLENNDIANFGYDRVDTVEVNGIKVGLFGINQSSQTDPEGTMIEDIDELRDEGCALVIGVFHWGIELDYEPSAEQVELAHSAIDNGCDVVLGTHPHVVQGVELYNGRYICYSLGNFCFGGNSDPTDYNTMIFQQTFTFEDGWLVVDEDTLADADVIPCSVSSSEAINNYQPTPLEGDDASSLLETINTCSGSLTGSSVYFSTELSDDGCAYIDVENTDLTVEETSDADEEESDEETETTEEEAALAGESADEEAATDEEYE